MKTLRLAIALLILLLALAVSWLLASESGLRWAYQRAQAYLPAELQVKQLSGKLIGPIRLAGIEYRQDHTLIKTDAVVLDWQPAALFTGKLRIKQLSIRSLDIMLPGGEASAEARAQTGNIALPDIKLPLRISLEHAEVDGFKLHQDTQVYTLNKIRSDAVTLSEKINIGKLGFSADNFAVVLNGEIEPEKNYLHIMSLNWLAKLPSGSTLTGRGQLSGDISSTHFTQQLTGPVQLVLDAQINDLLGKLNWQAKVEVAQLDSTKLDATLPALHARLRLDAEGNLHTATLTGTLDANSDDIGAFDARFKLQATTDNTITLNSLQLQLADSHTKINLSGHLAPGNNSADVDLALDWKNLRWPLTGAAIFDSASGNGTVKGTLDAYRVTLSSDSPWRELLPSTWQATATGNSHGLDIQSLQVHALNGVASAKGRLSWSPVLSWQADIDAGHIDPASLWPAWPGQLGGKLTTRGEMQNGVLSSEATIHYIKGSLRGYPVALHSRLDLRGDKLDIDLLDFRSGDSVFKLSGKAAKSLSLAWEFASGNLAELYPGAAGQFHAQGTVTGSRENPEIAARIAGRKLQLADNAIASIEGTLAVDLFRWQNINIDLAAESLALSDFTLQTLAINADAQHMQLTATSEQARAAIEIQGSAYANGWRGEITRAELQSGQLDHWQLTAPVALDISEKNFIADQLCWHSDKDAGLCLTLEHTSATWQSAIAASKFPLRVLAPWLPPELYLEGIADASAKLDYRAPDQLLGQAQITLSPGTLSYPLLEGERELWEYHSGKLEIALDEKQINASSDVSLENGDRFHAELVLPAAQLLRLDTRRQTIQASAKLNVHDLGFIEALVPDIQDLKGEAELNVSLAGTLARPKLNGRAQFSKGTLRIPRLGLNIDQMSLKSQSDGFEKINFVLAAHSGDGNLAISGQTLLDSKAGWPTEIGIRGNDFEVAHITEARVQVSPELAIQLKQHRIEISGKILVPYAKLQPKDITTAAHVSDDAVVIGGEQNAEKKWIVHTRVRLTLGDRVNFYGYGFEGRFSGNLLIEDEPGQLTRATGEISVAEGRYRAYGQRLDVEQGRLLFTGGPLTNPGLDLRAVRKVNDVTAGLRVKGSLNHPVLELFSVPSMGETDALSYLLLGRPLENASSEEGAMMAKATLALGLSGGDRLARLLGDRFGLDEMRLESSEDSDQASLVLGRYLSPKLYVSYGVGLIEAFNTFTVRYQISDKWQLKAESGKAQGADLLYTFER